MSQVDMNQALSEISKFIEIALNGEEVILTPKNQPMVKLVPMQPNRKRPSLFGSDKGLISISDDFDEDDEDFELYIMMR